MKTAMPFQHSLELQKGLHLFLFRWNDGDEYLLEQHMREMVASPKYTFDMFDMVSMMHIVKQKSRKQ